VSGRRRSAVDRLARHRPRPIDNLNAEQQDFILLRTDGAYNFGVVDDVTMGVNLPRAATIASSTRRRSSRRACAPLRSSRTSR
jgi:hypothetical protein